MKFKQETNSILFAYWSQRQGPSRSCKDWHQWITSCTIFAQCLEETSRRGILDLYWSFDSKKSNSIECNHRSRNTSSLLYSESCEIENVRSLTWAITHVSLTTTKDLITTRSRLDQRESSIGFYSSSTEGEVFRQSRGEVQHATFSQLTQPIPKQICDRSG